MGRGRTRRNLRRQAATVLRAGAVERARPDPEGAPVRPHQQRGQPRRGRQGVLLLPRQHADPLVHEVSLQVSAARVSLPGPGRDQPEPIAGRGGVRTARYRRVRRRPVLRRVRRIRQGEPGGHPGPHHRPQPRARSGRLQVLPTLWFRNTWSWDADEPRPSLREVGPGVIQATHSELGEMWLHCDGSPDLLFTENESNAARLWGRPNATPYVKDAFHDYVISGTRRSGQSGHEPEPRLPPNTRSTCPAAVATTVRLRLAPSPA